MTVNKRQSFSAALVLMANSSIYFLQVAVEMKAILFMILFTDSPNVSTTIVQNCAIYFSIGGSVSLMIKEQYACYCCVGFRKSKLTRKLGEGYIFDILLLALHKIRVCLDLAPAAFGPKLSLEKSGRDGRGEKLLALSIEKPPG